MIAPRACAYLDHCGQHARSGPERELCRPGTSATARSVTLLSLSSVLTPSTGKNTSVVDRELSQGVEGTMD